MNDSPVHRILPVQFDMTEVIIAILFTTGVCAYMFFFLPWLDSRKKNGNDQPGSDN